MNMPLFDHIPDPAPVREPSPLSVRRKRIREAFAGADARWREAYENFILQYAETHGEFSAEDVRTSFASNPKNPKPQSERASGYIFIRLVRDGKLKKSGVQKSAKYGNYLQCYVKGDAK